jgi:hypothetical protein
MWDNFALVRKDKVKNTRNQLEMKMENSGSQAVRRNVVITGRKG